MTTPEDALREATARAWNADQRASLRGAFTALRDFLKSAVILRGKRVTTTADVVGSVLGTLAVECPFKPRSVTVLAVSGATLNIGNVPLVWTWASTASGGTITFDDAFAVLGAVPDGTYTFDLLLERE